MTFGEQEISWLTKEEKKILNYFDKLVHTTGDCTPSERKSKFWATFWFTLCLIICVCLVWTTWHYRNDFDIAAYAIHHLVLFLDDIAIVVVLYINRRQLQFLLQTSKKTYGYESEFIEKFSKKLIRERIGVHRVAQRVLIGSAIGIFVEVEVFFLIEELVFKTYRTLFPFYIGLDLNDPFVYFAVVCCQELICYLTACMPLMAVTIGYISWSHIDLELEIFKFAVSHITEVVKEQMRHPMNEDMKGKTEHELYDIYAYHLAKHHTSIAYFFREFNHLMYVTTTLVFLTGFCLMVVVLLSTFSDNTGIKLKLIGFFIAQTMVIYGWCTMGQAIGDKGDEISEVLNGAPWWLMPKRSRSTVLMMIIGSQQRLSLTTPFGQVANKECFMDLISSIYQFVSVVLQMRHGS